MQWVTAAQAIRAIPDGSRVVLPHGAVEPQALYDAFAVEHARFRTLALYSGLQFGGYRYLDAGLRTHFTYTTWQAAGRLKARARAGDIDFLPLRFSQIPATFAATGPLPADVVIIQTTPPERGQVSLGLSVSIFPVLVAEARLVIAEVNPGLPRTQGAALLPVEHIDLAVESAAPIGIYAPRARTSRDDTIVDRVLDLIPERAWVQLGVGAIPDAVLPRLVEIRGINLHSGILTDGLVDVIEGAAHAVRAVAGEVAGSARLYDFLARTAAVELHPTSVTHSVFVAGRLPRFVAVNSVIEVDLAGQMNGEVVDGVQMSGVGGSLDFMEAASYAPDGISIVAMPSTTDDGQRSRIVAALGAGAPATIPRVVADLVVTEYGTARLRGRTLRERQEALIAIAHPDFRDRLANDVAGHRAVGPPSV